MRAIIEGTDVVAPLLADDEWLQLSTDVRTGAKRVVLPCCGGRGLLRTSRRGLKHFYHVRDDHDGVEDCAGARGETMAHLAAKAAIAAACVRAGYTPATECTERDWRADVLAVRGAARLAFEVQWSRQTLAETMERQQRYAQAGVRGCWFFRQAPPELRESWNVDPHMMVARRDLPAFVFRQQVGAQASEKMGAETDAAVSDMFSVYLQSEVTLPLDACVEALLTRRVAFCERAVARGEQRVEIRLFGVRCWSCGKYTHAYAVAQGQLRSPCGRLIWSEIAGDAEGEYYPEVVRAVRHYCQTHQAQQGRPFHVGEVTRVTRRGMTFTPPHCFWCHAPLLALERERRRALLYDEYEARFEASLYFMRPPMRSCAHWCYAADGLLCEGR